MNEPKNVVRRGSKQRLHQRLHFFAQFDVGDVQAAHHFCDEEKSMCLLLFPFDLE